MHVPFNKEIWIWTGKLLLGPKINSKCLIYMMSTFLYKKNLVKKISRTFYSICVPYFLIFPTLPGWSKFSWNWINFSYARNSVKKIRVPAVVQRDRWCLWSTGTQIQSPAQHSALRIQCFHRLQLWPGSDSWPRNSICHGAAEEKGKGEKKICQEDHESKRDYSFKKKVLRGIPVVAQWKQIRLVCMSSWVPSLASLSRWGIHHALGCGVGRRLGSDLALLWQR